MELDVKEISEQGRVACPHDKNDERIGEGRMLRTAEFVTPMHPDKICDRIADAILDECLKQDKDTRAAIQVMGGHGIISVTGQITTTAYVDISKVVRGVYRAPIGFQVNVVNQSVQIARGVDIGGAGDQGIAIGYACNDNYEKIPQEYYYARSLCKYLYDLYPYDGKTQITMDQDDISFIVASFQNVSKNQLFNSINNWYEENVGDPNNIPQIYCNPAGDWDIGGFDADTGVVGRKIVVDAYGPRVPVGGGAYSGKDVSKIDRSAAYMARNLALMILKEIGEAYEVQVNLAYVIGREHPIETSIFVDGKQHQGFKTWVFDNFDLTPNGIIEYLKLKQITNYSEIASWGHYGHQEYNWEKI